MHRVMDTLFFKDIHSLYPAQGLSNAVISFYIRLVTDAIQLIVAYNNIIITITNVNEARTFSITGIDDDTVKTHSYRSYDRLTGTRGPSLSMSAQRSMED